MSKKGLYILTFTLLILSFFSYIFLKNDGLDSVENSILSANKIEYLGNGKTIFFSVEKLSDEVDYFIDSLKPKKQFNPDSIFNEYQNAKSNNSFDSYLNVLASEINKYESLKFNGSKYAMEKESRNFNFAKFYYNGYLNGVEFRIYADSNKNVSCLELKSNHSHYHSMHERFLFLNGEIVSISRNYMILKSIGFNGESLQYDYEQEIFKFAKNSLFEIFYNSKGVVEKTRIISDEKSKRYLRVSLLLRKIAQAIIENPKINCSNRIAYIGEGSDEWITKYFDMNFKTDTFFKKNNEKYIYSELVGVSISENGNVDKVLINPFSGDGFSGNEIFYNKVTDEVKRILMQSKWTPEIKNCVAIKSLKEIRVVYNYIVKDNKLDLKSGNKGKFIVYQERDGN